MTVSLDASPVVRVPLDRYPGIASIARDLVHRVPAATTFCPPLQADRIAPPRSPRLRSELVAALERENAAWGNDVGSELAAWQRGETITLIAGQQVGFAGGPLYTAAKIASLLHLKRSLEAGGRKATAFFWMATEDHDFDEVARLSVATAQGVVELRAPEAARSRHVVGELAVPDELRSGFARLTGQSPRWLAEGLSFRDSFAMLLADAFAGELVLVDALLPELRAAGRAQLEALVARHDELQEALGRRSAELQSAGYRPQVEPRDGSFSLLYLLEEGVRLPVRKDAGGSWRIDEKPTGRERITAVIGSEPARVSTAAIARPVLQDAVFEPDVFIGGPAELAYYAQAGVLHDLLGIRLPAIALRAHLLLAPARLLRKAEKYGLAPFELLDRPEEIIARREPGAVAETRAAIGAAEAIVLPELEKLRRLATATDGTLDRPTKRSIRSVNWHFRKMADRAAAAAARRDAERYRALQQIHATLLPAGEPQDRTVAWSPWWLDRGDAWRARLVDAAEPDSSFLSVVGL